MLSYWSYEQEEHDIPPAPAGFMWPYQCEEWRKEQLNGVSPEDASVLRARLDELDQKDGYIVANAWLSSVVERYELLNKISVMRPVVAKEVMRLARVDGDEAAMIWLRRVVKRLHFCDKVITELDGEGLHKWAEERRYKFESTLYRVFMDEGSDAMRRWIDANLQDVGVEFDCWGDTDKVAGMTARMITPEWWVRQAKKQWVVVESVLRECGQVERFKSPYLSNWALNKAEKQKENNRAFLESWEAVNDFGQCFSLAQLSEKGVSNPDNRFSELIVRAKGLEEIALEEGHDGWFLTLTSPSKYHPMSDGHRNPKFWRAGCPTVRETHLYMMNVWKKFRAWCSNHGIQFYGLRTVEPHHDGTPHWHLMLWVEPARSAEFLDAFKRYALEEDGNERGAKKYRVKIEKIDQEKGSAVGYIVKYISKNIHGKHVDTDHETGRSGTDAANRIVGWARLNRIRQFQFVGGASVTVWRELRRLGKDKAPKHFSDIYHAANRADYGGFVKLMGGVFAGKYQTLKAHYSDAEQNQYGEMVKSVKGVARGVEVVVTRLYEWTIQRSVSGSGSSSLEEREAVPWTRVNNCTRSVFDRNYEPTNYGGGDQYVGAS
ncbi:replication endonuclease [Marinomonas arenicola]|uniref:replication endonuclease n=1 Tax=Marinomonas arenicola TaxID=569601 RepID=UPI00311EBA00